MVPAWRIGTQPQSFKDGLTGSARLEVLDQPHKLGRIAEAFSYIAGRAWQKGLIRSATPTAWVVPEPLLWTPVLIQAAPSWLWVPACLTSVWTTQAIKLVLMSKHPKEVSHGWSPNIHFPGCSFAPWKWWRKNNGGVLPKHLKPRVEVMSNFANNHPKMAKNIFILFLYGLIPSIMLQPDFVTSSDWT